MAASGETLPAAPSDSLMRLGSVRDVVLARVPIEAHRALAQTCKALRRLVYSDDFAKLRKTLGFEEYGLLLLAGRIYEDGGAMVERGKQFVCLTHNLESLGFAAQTDCPLDLDEFTTALSTEGRLFVCGDANHDRKLLIYDTRKHEWVRDPRYPASIPVVMYGQCTAFLDNTLVVVAGGTNAVGRPWGFSWDEQLRMWQSLPPVPTVVAHASYGVIGSCLFVVGGYSRGGAHAEQYGGVMVPGATMGRMSSYTARLQIFDMTTRTWSLGPPLDALKDRMEEPTTAAVFHRRLYVFCQRAMDSCPDAELCAQPYHVYCFDPNSNSWSELPALPVGSHSELAACVHDGRLVVAGTVNYDPEPFHEINPPATYHYEWDDGAEMWKERPLLIDDGAWPRGKLGSLVSVPLRIR
ncbi:unnamed protein product [Pelagomonas calceolata]|uniref:F-box domain-containing protein n=1 Tax=Pelagomonas calceolata TaxID=35677 RepID=A0A7S4A481_9STRA|nr:unnamed protein product [Pelagomonas calceolata]